MSWRCWGVTSVTLFKLSLRNAKRQANDYLVYFVTVIMAAALVYAFNGLVFSQELKSLSKMMDSLPLVIVLASAVVVCIIGWLVQHTTGFMLSRRSRELGTYILIGLENRQVAQLFFLENLAVGGVALVLGTLLGNLLFQALRAITLALFDMPYTFSFAVSIEAVGLTALYFALIYLLALLRGRRHIQKMKICDLIYFDRKNEAEVIQKCRSRQRIFVLSIVSGIIGTLLLLMGSFPLGVLGSCFVILFLYGFFISFSSGVPAYFERHIQQKYSGQTLLIFRTLSSKLATMGVLMATIAVLFTATLISEGTGVLFTALFQSRAEQTTCFDLFLGTGAKDDTCFDDYIAYIDENIPVRAAKQYKVYNAQTLQVTEYLKANSNFENYIFEYDTWMKASDYTQLRAMLGYSPVECKPGQYLMHGMTYVQEALERYAEPVTVGGVDLAPGGVFTEPFTQSLWDGNGQGFILVVPDEAVAALPVSHSVYAVMTETPVSAEHFDALRDIREAKDNSEEYYDTVFSKAAEERENAAMCATIVFPLYYLALVLTMAAATILTMQQLCETSHYRRQFELLRKLGMDRSEMKRVLRRQFAIYYTMPAVPPLLISIPFLLALGGTMDPGVLSGTGQLILTVGAALGLFLSIYLIYILMAYTSLKRNVLPK